jgi:hypothetical protein
MGHQIHLVTLSPKAPLFRDAMASQNSLVLRTLSTLLGTGEMLCRIFQNQDAHKLFSLSLWGYVFWGIKLQMYCYYYTILIMHTNKIYTGCTCG